MDKELQQEEEWDFERAEKREPPKRQRAVVSVAFNADDFDLVSDYADQVGMKLSEFIRSATVAKARGGMLSAHFVLQLNADRLEDIYLDMPQSTTHSLSEPVAHAS